MNNIKFGLFDLFSFAVPGCVIVIALTVGINNEIKSVADLFEIFADLGATTLIILLGLSYVVGFATYGLGSWVYRFCNRYFWKENYKNNYYGDDENSLDPAYRWAVIREESNSNFSLINRWAALKGMAMNLTVGLFITGVSCVFKIDSGYFFQEWIYLFFSCIILSVLLLYRARVYKKIPST